MVRVTSSNTDHQQKISASLHAELNGLTAGASFKAAMEEAERDTSSHTEVDIQVHQTGGVGDQIQIPGTEADSIRDHMNRFAAAAHASAAAYEAELLTYDTLVLPLPARGGGRGQAAGARGLPRLATALLVSDQRRAPAEARRDKEYGPRHSHPPHEPVPVRPGRRGPAQEIQDRKAAPGPALEVRHGRLAVRHKGRRRDCAPADGAGVIHQVAEHPPEHRLEPDELRGRR